MYIITGHRNVFVGIHVPGEKSHTSKGGHGHHGHGGRRPHHRRRHHLKTPHEAIRPGKIIFCLLYYLRKKAKLPHYRLSNQICGRQKHSVGVYRKHGHFCPTFRDKIDKSFLRFFILTLVLHNLYTPTRNLVWENERNNWEMFTSSLRSHKFKSGN